MQNMATKMPSEEKIVEQDNIIDISDKLSTKAEAGILTDEKNIILIGMPGCGKSMIAQELSNRLGREVIDTDHLITIAEDMSITEIFAINGEEYFRDIESRIVIEATKGKGAIISTGGGAILREENQAAMKENSVVVLIDRPIEKLAMDGRPLSKSLAALRTIKAKRAPIYNSLCHVKISTEDDVVKTVDKIMAEF